MLSSNVVTKTRLSRRNKFHFISKLILAIALTLGFAATYVHIRVLDSDELTGTPAVLDHVFDLLLALLLSIVTLGIGNAILKLSLIHI